MANNFTNFDKGIRLVGQTSDPTPAQAGDLYYNTTNNVFRQYNGTSWSDVGTGAGVNTTLSNLTSPTSVNQDLIPANVGIVLGSPATRWGTVYTGNVSGGNLATLNFIGNGGNFTFADNANVNNQLLLRYLDSITLTASSTTSNVTGAISSSFPSQIIEYQITQATTNNFRVGRILATGHFGTNIGTINDSYVETADIQVTAQIQFSGGNFQINFANASANNCTIRLMVQRFRA